MDDLFPTSLTEEQVNRLISESELIEAALDDVFSSSFNPTTDEEHYYFYDSETGEKVEFGFAKPEWQFAFYPLDYKYFEPTEESILDFLKTNKLYSELSGLKSFEDFKQSHLFGMEYFNNFKNFPFFIEHFHMKTEKIRVLGYYKRKYTESFVGHFRMLTPKENVEDNTSCSDETIQPVYIIRDITDNICSEG